MPEERRGRRSGGRAGRAAGRAASAAPVPPYLTRQIPPYEIVGDEALEVIEHNADTILEEVGIDFRNHPRSLELLRDAGCDVDGERVRFPRGLARSIVQANAPRQYTQHARNPGRNVEIGGDHTVFALSLIHISEPTRLWSGSRMPASA